MRLSKIGEGMISYSGISNVEKQNGVEGNKRKEFLSPSVFRVMVCAKPNIH